MVLLLTAFIVFSINGAFLGARHAREFFNSGPMMVFWVVLLLTFIGGFAVYASLRKRFSILLIHAGCLLVLGGGMIGSEAGHHLLNRIFDKQSFEKGEMTLQRAIIQSRFFRRG